MIRKNANKIFLFIATALILVTWNVSSTHATYLQLHSPVDFDDVAYIFTLWNLPVGGDTVDLKECEWKNIPMPWYATDAHHIVGMGITSETCSQAIGAFQEDTPGHFTMNELDAFFMSTGEDIITWPWLISYTEEVHYGVDLAAYYDAGTASCSRNLWDIVSFVDGVNADLPGFIVGTSDIYWDDTVGWTTDNLFTGDLHVAGEGGTCIPEPSTLVLLGFGLVGITTKLRRKRLSS